MPASRAARPSRRPPPAGTGSERWGASPAALKLGAVYRTRLGGGARAHPVGPRLPQLAPGDDPAGHELPSWVSPLRRYPGTRYPWPTHLSSTHLPRAIWTRKAKARTPSPLGKAGPTQQDPLALPPLASPLWPGHQNLPLPEASTAGSKIPGVSFPVGLPRLVKAH